MDCVAQMDTFEVDTVIAGAGVVGLAVARGLALAGREVLILEKNPVLGEETSARNSEVIHAGLYYDAGSLKARHCVRGRDMLYEFCEVRGVPHRNCGKLIVATNATEGEKLPAIAARAEANGVHNLRMLKRAEALELEPALDVFSALLSPSSGIVDSHSFMLSLLGEAEAHGAQLVTLAEIVGGCMTGRGDIELNIAGDEPMRLKARSFVNCAGLWASQLAGKIDGLPSPPQLALVKGNYFSCSRKAPFSHLVYPVPSDGGLGVHLTLDLAGRARFGPDTEWLTHQDPRRIDYSVAANGRAQFAQAIQTYWPELRETDLHPDYSGVRPKIAGATYPDFQILGPADLPGPHVMMYGVESPGLTGALSIAADAVDWLA